MTDESGNSYHGSVPRNHSGNRRSSRRPRRVPQAPRWWADLAALLAKGTPITHAAAELGRTRQAASRAAGDPRFAGLLEREEARQRAEAERLLALARPAAVRALQGVLETAEADPGAVQPRDVLGAATALLNASAPPSRAVLERAEREFMKRLHTLDPELAKRVGEVMAGDDAAALASASLEELDAVIRGER